MLVYNGQIEPLISLVFLSFRFSRQGIIEPTIEIDTVPLDPYHTAFAAKILMEVLFTSLLARLVFIQVLSAPRLHALAATMRRRCADF
jgi:hypothetical protein